MIKPNEVARKVLVKLNNQFVIKSIADRNLACEKILYIDDNKIHNDQFGDWVWVRGGSGINKTLVYLKELDLAFPIDGPLYTNSEIDYLQDLSQFKSDL
jgi:hypothetical protein